MLSTDNNFKEKIKNMNNYNKKFKEIKFLLKQIEDKISDFKSENKILT